MGAYFVTIHLQISGMGLELSMLITCEHVIRMIIVLLYTRV